MWLVHNPRLYISNDESGTSNDTTTLKLNSSTKLMLKNHNQTTNKVFKDNRKHRLLNRTIFNKGTFQIITIIVSTIVMFLYFGKQILNA